MRLDFWYDYGRKKKKRCFEAKGGSGMRGYYSANGFWGLVDGDYRLFASEEDYYDMVE